MNDQLFVLNSQKKTTNHVLHLLLCIPTFGVWLIVWGLVISINSHHNKNIQRQMNNVLGYKVQGLSDQQTYQKLKEDKVKSDQVFVIVVVAVAAAIFFIFKS